MTPATTSPAPFEPLDLAEVKLHLKQDIADDDALIAVYLGSARAYAESYCSKRLVSAGLSIRLDEFPCDEIEIDVGPVIEIESIQYIDSAGALQTLPPADYRADVFEDPACIEPSYGKAWPATRCQSGAVIINFKAGYLAGCTFDATADTVTIKNWKALVVNEVIRFSNSGGALPLPLQTATNYYVQAVISAGVYKLSATSGGAAINLVDAGTGLQYMAQPGINWARPELPPTIKAWLMIRCDTAYSHRGENVQVGRGVLAPLPYVDKLLDSERLWIFK